MGADHLAGLRPLSSAVSQDNTVIADHGDDQTIHGLDTGHRPQRSNLLPIDWRQLGLGLATRNSDSAHDSERDDAQCFFR